MDRAGGGARGRSGGGEPPPPEALVPRKDGNHLNGIHSINLIRNKIPLEIIKSIENTCFSIRKHISFGVDGWLVWT